ncbi:DNA repair ATPase [Pontibacter qinzhouensis]|uniref:DNA repair ATPase n=1 Tax=Pontibacter qinzhouensis TaxID=2603253 RepID=A0A5C8K8Q7_9BACT|nr:DNA repair ATPase [Pontibacter qinzhouensis]TXK47133.1 DNA repair ATPase [Pontibacter qinzhouensis]
MRTRLLLAGLFVFLAVFAKAQSVKVEEREQPVDGVARRGQQLTVQLDPKLVEKSWKEHLGEKAGKVKYRKGVYSIEGAVIDTISSAPLRVISKVGNSSSEESYVWWSLDMGTAYVDKSATPAEYAAAENFMRGFARKVYRQDVLRQINEAEDVLRATKLEQDRVVKQANDIQLNIEKNRKRKQELEAEMAKNTEELKQLELTVEQSTKQQELSRQQVLEMEKSVEGVRLKLQTIK